MLDPRLEPFVMYDGFKFIQHPLICVYPYAPIELLVENINKNFIFKINKFRELYKKKDWISLLLFIERPFRIPALIRYQNKMSDEGFWACLGYVYTDSENVDQFKKEVYAMFTSNRDCIHELMSDKELDFLEALDETVTVFKGYNETCEWDDDLSFTLCRDVAYFFATRFESSYPQIITAQTKKTDIIACFLRRGEMEVIIDPNHVEIVGVEAKVRKISSKSKIESELVRSVNRLHGERYERRLTSV